MAAFKIVDAYANTSWHYLVDIDAQHIIAHVFHGKHLSYDISLPYSDAESVVQRHLSAEFWDWLPEC